MTNLRPSYAWLDLEGRVPQRSLGVTLYWPLKYKQFIGQRTDSQMAEFVQRIC